MIQNNFNDSASKILHAICYGTVAEAKSVLDQHPDLLTDGPLMTELMGFSARKNLPDMIRFLASAGVSVESTNDSDEFPLWHAVQSGNVECVRTLLDLGADSERVCEQDTALHRSLIFVGRTLEIPSLLLNRGADPDKIDRWGRTALHGAVLLDSEPIVHLLMAHGANPNVMDAEGRTPLYLAVSRANEEMARLLLTCGADPGLSSPLLPCGVIEEAENLALPELADLMRAWKHANDAQLAIKDAASHACGMRPLP